MSGVDETPSDAAERVRLDALRRTAFGRTRSPADEAAAAKALAALRTEHEQRERKAAERRAFECAAEPDHTASTPDPDAPVSERSAPFARVHPATSARRNRGEARWLVPAASLLAAVGAVVAAIALAGDGDDLAATTTTSPPSAPLADASPFIVPGSAGAGSVVAAAQWFLEPQSSDDAFPGVDGFDSIDAESTRLVWGADGDWSLWVATTVDSELCLLASSATNRETVVTCTPQAAFLESGLTLTHSNGIDPEFSVFWNGNSITQTGG